MPGAERCSDKIFPIQAISNIKGKIEGRRGEKRQNVTSRMPIEPSVFKRQTAGAHLLALIPDFSEIHASSICNLCRSNTIDLKLCC